MYESAAGPIGCRGATAQPDAPNLGAWPTACALSHSDSGQLLCAAGHADEGKAILARSRDGFLRLGQAEVARQVEALLQQLLTPEDG